MAAAFPRMRWVALAWLAVWVPAYWRVWGWENFLRVCDVAVILTCVGLWRGSALLLSSQAINAILTDFAWCLDVGWRLASGRHLFGGTEYMWDAQYPLWVRLLSLFHVLLPVVLVWALVRIGYDRRGWLLQTGIAAALLVVSRFFSPATNMNYSYRDPFFGHAWGPAPVHLALVLGGMIIVLYFPTHVVLSKTLPQPAALRG